MVTRRYKVEELYGEEIRLGRVGENNARIIEFDVNTWLDAYNGGFVVVFVTPPAGTGSASKQQGYLVPVTVEDGIVSWTVRSSDTRTAGNGTLELLLYGPDNRIIQSTTVATKIYSSSSHIMPPPMQQPSHDCDCHSNANPNQSWIDQVARIAYDAQEAAYRAEEALDEMRHFVYEGSVPDGGEAGQVLTKLSGKDQDIGWQDAVGGEGYFDEIDMIYGGDASEPA